jgi:type IV secretory pathway ATPase VirB11/archaellum biosynthesis ATPase
MSLKPIAGWIMEGTVASGKTTLIQALQQILIAKYPPRTKIFISEHYTERVLEDQKASGNLTPI